MDKRPLCELPCFGVHHRYALLSSVQITAYNLHLGLLVPSLFGWIPQSLLGPLRGRRRYDISYRFVKVQGKARPRSAEIASE